MFTGLDVSLAREHTAGLLQESGAYRLGTRSRSYGGGRPGWRRTLVGLVSRVSASASTSAGLASGEGTMPKET